MSDEEIYKNIRSSFDKLGADLQHIHRRIDIIEGSRYIENVDKVVPPSSSPIIKEPCYNIGGTQTQASTQQKQVQEEDLKAYMKQQIDVSKETVAQVLQELQNVMNKKIDQINGNIENVTVCVVRNEKNIKKLTKDVKELEEFLVGEQKQKNKDDDRKDGYVNIDNLPSTNNGEEENE